MLSIKIPWRASPLGLQCRLRVNEHKRSNNNVSKKSSFQPSAYGPVQEETRPTLALKGGSKIH
jgi:hypothetical protein